MESFGTDLRFAWRSLWKHPSLTLIAVVALALGIGANTAIFSVVQAVLLKPLPFPEPDRVIRLIDVAPDKLRAGATSPPDFADWQAQNRAFSHLAAIGTEFVNLTGEGEPERLYAGQVSGDFFGALGAKPLLGRPLLPAEDVAGGPNVAVLSSRFWQRRFGGDPGIVGRRLILNGEPTVIVGVVASSLDLPKGAELWLPLRLTVKEEQRGGHYLRVLGRLRPGVSLPRAQSEMSGIAARLAIAHPDTNTNWGIRLSPLRETMVENIRPALFVLLGAVGLVLLIACANVANLLLSRLAAREREVAVRTALGAGRGRLIRQFLTESTLLSLAGGLLGALLAAGGTPLLLALFGDRIPRAQEVGIDGAVLAFTLVLSLGTGLLFGLLPALHASSPNLQSTLRDGAKGAGDRRGRRTRSSLVFAEVALAIVLLVSAGLLVRSLRELQNVRPGFRSDHALSVQVALPESGYKEEPKQVAFYRDLLPRLAALPGVKSAAAGYPLPLSGNRYRLAFQAEGLPAEVTDLPRANMAFVSPDYFATLGIPLQQGRVFDGHEAIGGEKVTVINRTLAETIWRGQNPIGRRISFDVPVNEKSEWFRIVGVVGDVHHLGLDEDSGNQSYLPLFQSPISEAGLVVRTAGSPTGLAAAVTRTVRQIDPALPVADVKTLDALLADSVAEPRANAFLLSLLAALALVLSAVGVYGVLSYSVAERTREIGLRMALGAGAGQILRQLLREGLGIVLAGIAAGLLGAFFLARVLASLLFGVTTRDPLTFVGVPLVLLAVALIATWVPARRATKVEPVVALRYE
ncbi:MAG TPA: ABC transporter permease [Thermoanaerobaculia bacterium]|jgi:putative ABC transport system permease protein|nr:ABC transporter permease [Thermoanaerobaculia bacterium]